MIIVTTAIMYAYIIRRLGLLIRKWKRPPPWLGLGIASSGGLVSQCIGSRI